MVDRILGLATEAELQTLPVGLYQIATEVGGERIPRRDHRRVLDIYDDQVVSGQAKLLARVRVSGDLLDGVESITVRPDGKQIITQWVLDRD